jgi:hypothetical protein
MVDQADEEVRMIVSDTVNSAAHRVVPLPAWLEQTLRLQEGRDPLGLHTTTQDRLMPMLLPGILELSRRARYFSFHAFLLAEYQRERGKADSKVLSTFIKRAEWDLGLAVLRCPRCTSSPVGARRLVGVAQLPAPWPRDESVESPLGGYGLYYRSPMITIGVVASAGTLLGDEPIPIDLLYETKRARDLADGFRAAVADTAYYRERYLWTTQPLPAHVIDEYADAACLCQLRERSAERAAVHAALFVTDADSSPSPTTAVSALGDAAAEEPPATHSNDGEASTGATPASASSADDTVQRCRSVAHYLALLDATSEIVNSESAYRESLWAPPTPRSTEHAIVAGQWSALAAKDVWQEALCSIWSELCRVGLARTRAQDRGCTWQETRDLVNDLLDGPPTLAEDARTSELAEMIYSGEVSLPLGDDALVVSQCTLEELRMATRTLDTAASGLIVMLALARRMGERSGAGWEAACRVRSAWQPSVATVMQALDEHLESSPPLTETLWWVISRFVLPVHERIAYSKLPDFTFRFRWEDGLLRFYDLGVGRFTLAAIRRESLSQLTYDIGFWTTVGESPALTERGRAFVQEMLG